MGNVELIIETAHTSGVPTVKIAFGRDRIHFKSSLRPNCQQHHRAQLPNVSNISFLAEKICALTLASTNLCSRKAAISISALFVCRKSIRVKVIGPGVDSAFERDRLRCRDVGEATRRTTPSNLSPFEVMLPSSVNINVLSPQQQRTVTLLASAPRAEVHLARD